MHTDAADASSASSLNRLAYGLLLGVLLWAPLPLGSNRPWSSLLLSLLVAAALVLLAVDWLRHGCPSRRRVFPLWPLGIFVLAFVALQALPLPPAWVQLLSPHSAALYAALPQAQEAAWWSISVDPGSTLDQLLLLATYFVVFLLASVLVNGRRRLQRLAMVLVVAASLNAVYGLFNYLNAGQFGFFRPASWWTAAITGTYVNKNHFAGLMEMVFPLAMAGTAIALHRTDGLRSGLAGFLNAWPQLGAAVLIGGALALSGSRAGALILLALLLAGFWGFVAKVEARRTRRAIVGFIAIAALLLAVLWQGGLGRLLSSDLGGSRITVWVSTLEALPDYWLFGSGAGTFRWVFTQYKSAAVDPLIYDHAHNGYLELLLEYGLIGSLLMAGFVMAALWRGVRALKTAHDVRTQLLRLGLLLGVLAMLLHELVDFNLTIPANGVVFFAMLGALSAAQRNGRRT